MGNIMPEEQKNILFTNFLNGFDMKFIIDL